MSDTTESGELILDSTETSFPCEACKRKCMNSVAPSETDHSVTVSLAQLYKILRDYSSICFDCRTYIDNVPQRSSSSSTICPLCQNFPLEMLSNSQSAHFLTTQTKEKAAVGVDDTINRAELILQSTNEDIPNSTQDNQISFNTNEFSISTKYPLFTNQSLQVNHETEQKPKQQNLNPIDIGLNHYTPSVLLLDKLKKNDMNEFIRDISTSNCDENTSVTESIQASNYITTQDKLNELESTNSNILKNLLERQSDCVSNCDTNDLIQTIADKYLPENGNVAPDWNLVCNNKLNHFNEERCTTDRVKEWIATIPGINNDNGALSLHNAGHSSTLPLIATNENAENVRCTETNSLTLEVVSSRTAKTKKQFQKVTASKPKSIRNPENVKTTKEYLNKCVKDTSTAETSTLTIPNNEIEPICRFQNANKKINNLLEKNHFESDSDSETNQVYTHSKTNTETSSDTENSSLVSLLRMVTNDKLDSTNQMFFSDLEDYTYSSTPSNYHDVGTRHALVNSNEDITSVTLNRFLNFLNNEISEGNQFQSSLGLDELVIFDWLPPEPYENNTQLSFYSLLNNNIDINDDYNDSNSFTKEGTEIP